MSFEAEVRRAAEAVFNIPAGDCQPKRYLGELVIGELDGIVQLRDIVHLLMATTSSKLEKVKEDVKKLKAAERIEQKSNSGRTIQGWLITERQLDPLHIKYANDNNVKIMTLQDFIRRCFDGSKYIARRSRYPFGSAVHPRDGSQALDDQKYVPLPMVAEQSSGPQGKTKSIDLEGLGALLSSGETCVLLAPFGAGKSFTARELYRDFAKQLNDGTAHQAPVVLNLRDHWGEEYGDEILERHARAVGFSPKEELTIGWRAGLVTLILDGFDEVASQLLARREDRNFMRQARRSALTGVRDLLTKLPPSCGVLISGRDHYFDGESEMAHALGLLGRPYRIIRLGEFDEQSALQFLRNNGVDLPLPDWLPRKPLLLGYLAHRNILSDVLEIDGGRGHGYVWHRFLDLVCDREASLATSTMDPATLRLVLENLASYVRGTASGTGPLAETDLVEAYRAVAGQTPADAVIAQLQRLPGLTERGQVQGTRSFVDEDMLHALQGGAVARYILHGSDVGTKGSQWLNGLSARGIDSAAFLLEQSSASPSVALSRAHSLLNQGALVQLAADCIAVAIAMTAEGGTIDCLGLILQGASLDKIDLEQCNVRNLELRDCTIGEVLLGEHPEMSSLQLRSCLINRVCGVANQGGLPESIFDSTCEVGEFDHLETNNAIVKSDLPPKVKALITVLRKLYMQSGTGRKLSAFHRGIPPGPISDNIDDVVTLLQREKLLSIYNKVAQPVRKETDRVKRMLRAPAISDDPLIIKLRS